MSIRECRNHSGDDCEKCAGTGYRKECQRPDCRESGCDGSGACIPRSDEIEHFNLTKAGAK